MRIPRPIDRLLGLLFLPLATSQLTASSQPDHLLAHYRFQTNGEDSLARCPSFTLTNDLPLRNGVLYVDGIYHQDHTEYLASGPIPALNYESFTIGLQFYPLPAGVRKKALNRFESRIDTLIGGRYRKWFGHTDWNKRNIITGGRSYRWFGFNRGENNLTLTLNNQTFSHEFKRVRVKPDRWHSLICSVDVKNRRILTMFDGKELEPVELPAGFALEIVGSPDEATDRQLTFMNMSNGSVFYGYAAHLKIFDRALGQTELAELSKQAFAERPRFPKSTPSLSLYLALAAILVIVTVLVGLIKFRKTAPAP